MDLTRKKFFNKRKLYESLGEININEIRDWTNIKRRTHVNKHYIETILKIQHWQNIFQLHLKP